MPSLMGGTGCFSARPDGRAVTWQVFSRDPDALEVARRSLVRECAILAGAATVAAPVIRWLARRLTDGR